MIRYLDTLRSMCLLDIHTHHSSTDGTAILSIAPSELSADCSNTYFSVGYHPWSLHADRMPDWNLLEEAAHHPQVLAIGETGLDKLIDCPILLQEEALLRHVHIAMQTRKPLVLHCVRAYNELIHLRKEIPTEIIPIIHGYRGNATLARQLLSKGFYLSFGAYYHDEALRATPLDRLFLETDESDIPIRTLYERAAALRQVETDLFTRSVQETIVRVFKPPLPPQCVDAGHIR
ncbi:MAG: TatD family hydrolase [Prevotellaceae bacterium]|nr:TatD family hydrolase [Prevotellaceae bacterium]